MVTNKAHARDLLRAPAAAMPGPRVRRGDAAQPGAANRFRPSECRPSARQACGTTSTGPGTGRVVCGRWPTPRGTSPSAASPWKATSCSTASASRCAGVPRPWSPVTRACYGIPRRGGRRNVVGRNPAGVRRACARRSRCRSAQRRTRRCPAVRRRTAGCSSGPTTMNPATAARGPVQGLRPVGAVHDQLGHQRVVVRA